MSSNKVMVIGIDGASYNTIINNLDKLSFYKELFEKGCFAPLNSVIPPVTAPAWSTSYTGKNPARSGICGMFKVDKQTYGNIMYSASDRVSKDVYEIAGELGKKCVAMGMPYTYPPRKVNGFLISGRFKAGGFPKELTDKIMKDHDYRLYSARPSKISYVKKSIESRFKMAESIFKEHEWDLGMLGFEQIDSIQHNLLLEDPEGINSLYKVTDECLRKFVDGLGNDVTVILYSDHGFKIFPKRFYGSRWLVKKGFLKLKSKESIKILQSELKKKKISILKNMSGNVFGFVFKYLIFNTKERLRILFPNLKYPKFLRSFARFAQVNISNEEKPVMYEESIAFMASQTMSNFGGIYINSKGKYSNGIVDPEEYDKVREKIIQELYDEVDPETNKKIVKEVFRREDVVHGPFSEDCPDIFFKCDDVYYVSESMFNVAKGEIFENLPIANHERAGIFGSIGKNIGNSRDMKLDIVDIMPTILYSLGLSIPNGLDGNVRTEIFDDNYLKNNKVTNIEFKTEIPRTESDQLTENDKKEISQKLKDLGYVD